MIRIDFRRKENSVFAAANTIYKIMGFLEKIIHRNNAEQTDSLSTPEKKVEIADTFEVSYYQDEKYRTGTTLDEARIKEKVFLTQNADSVIRNIVNVLDELPPLIEPYLNALNSIEEDCLSTKKQVEVKDSEALNYLTKQLDDINKIKLPSAMLIDKPQHHHMNCTLYDHASIVYLMPYYCALYSFITLNPVHKIKKEIEQQLYGLKIGIDGEKRIADAVKPYSFKYTILENVSLPSPDGGLAEIDLIVISKKGIFVIETKNRGKNTNKKLHIARDGKWSWASGNTSSRLFDSEGYTPIEQNIRHKLAIEYCLQKELKKRDIHLPIDYYPAIVFANDDIEIVNEGNNNVLRKSELLNFFEQCSGDCTLEETDIELISTIIQDCSIVKDKKRPFRDYAYIIDQLTRQEDYIISAISVFNDAYQNYLALNETDYFPDVIKIGFAFGANFYTPTIEKTYYKGQRTWTPVLKRIFSHYGKKDSDGYIFCPANDFYKATNYCMPDYNCYTVSVRGHGFFMGKKNAGWRGQDYQESLAPSWERKSYHNFLRADIKPWNEHNPHLLKLVVSMFDYKKDSLDSETE